MADIEQDPTLAVAAGEGSGRSQWVRFAVLGAVAVLAIGYMIYAAFPGNTRYFLTVGEFLAGPEYQDGRMVRVSGKLMEESFQRQNGSTLSQFQLIDEAAGTEVALNASYVGVMPDLFFNPHSEIILEGRYGPEKVFEADSILVKCPSKYRALEEEQRLQQPPVPSSRS